MTVDHGVDDLEAMDRLKTVFGRLKEQMGRIIVGQNEVIEQLLLALFCNGHCILEGVPGLAKTLMISTLARSLSLSFSRIQFTPDLMPADITGTEVIEENRSTGERERRFLEGPVFAHIVLADEINRTPPKTQAALLEAMQEKYVSVGRVRHRLPEPFFVLATQNPIEQEGTYPLPEAQQDRFMFKVFVKYPNFTDELEVARRSTSQEPVWLDPVVSADDILTIQSLVRRVPAPDHVLKYALAIVRQTRVGEEGVPPFLASRLTWGAGPRAVQFLVLGAKARAATQGRPSASCEDVAALAAPVLRHRLLRNFAAESDGITVDQLVAQLVRETPQREDELARDKRFAAILRS